MPLLVVPVKDIETALAHSTRQYLVGNLGKPQQLNHIPDLDVEIGISSYVNSGFEHAHRHALAKEYQYVLKGMTEYRDLDTHETHRFVAGDFYVIYPGTSYLQRIKQDTRIIFIKYPSGNDKEQVSIGEKELCWAKEPLRVRRLDLIRGSDTPLPNSLKPAVAVAIFDESDHLLLVKRRDSGYWTMPGGTMELSESLEMCARREVREETGIDIEVIGAVGTYSNPDTIVAYSDGEVRREFSILLAATARNTVLAHDEESTAATWANTKELDNYPMVDSQRRRVTDALRFRCDGTFSLR